jgi:UDP-N-acetylmuramate dehydrogenase
MENNVNFYTELKNIVEGTIKFNELLKNHTSFCIGGPADVLIVPKDEEDLRKIVILCNKYKVPLCVIGNGTKILVGDKGIRGIVIKISNVVNEIRFIEEGVLAGSGMPISRLSTLTAEKGLSGLEFAIGIPGTVGGAVVMNAGAHGRSISDIIISATVMNLKGETHVLSKRNLEFDYRRSVLQKTGEIVLNATFKLRKRDRKKIQRKIEEFVQWRKKTQPLGLPNAGSIFKNPRDDYAGRLIDAAGLKGARVGNAQVSTLRGNFIVNLGEATAEDVLTLMHIVQREVYKKFKVNLTTEIKVLGE